MSVAMEPPVLSFQPGSQLGSMEKIVAIQPSADVSSSQDTQDICAILPKRTRVLILGNNRTKRSLIGREGIVKKAVGLGGWHYIVLGNGEEVKLQRNALSVLELAADDGQDSSSDEMTEAREPQIEILTRPRIRRPPKALSPVPDVIFKRQPMNSMAFVSSSGGGVKGSSSSLSMSSLVNTHKLETLSLRRYKRVFQLPAPADPAAPRDELLQAVQEHLAAQVLDEQQVLVDFVSAVKRRHKQQQLLIKQYPSHYSHLLHPPQQRHQQLCSSSLHHPGSLQHY